MIRITIDDVKRQCRIEHDEEDELLAGYIDAAYSYTQNFINMPLYEFYVPDGERGQQITPAINQACLMLIGYWYANREAVTATTVQVVDMPYGVTHLLQPYRLMGV